MNSSHKSTAALALGALSIAFAACAASSDNTPGGSAGQSSSGGSGNAAAGTVGTAGSSAGGPGAAGSPGAAGTSTGAAGYNTGVGGAVTGTAGAGTAGAGTAGAGTGAAGAAAMSCGTLTPVTGDPMCCVAAGTATDLAIDDLEDGDDTILPIGQRQGYWYTYGKDPTQVPKPQSFGGTAFVPGAGGHPCSLLPLPTTCKGMTGGVLFSADTMGSVPAIVAPATDSQAGIGVGFNNHFNKSCPYNAMAYKGISFWAKGTVPLKVVVTTPATVPASASVAGTCTGTMCYDSYSMLAAPPPDGTTWAQFTITFTDKTTFAQAGWGTVAAFDPSKIMDLQFQVDGSAAMATPYSFGIDDVAFVP